MVLGAKICSTTLPYVSSEAIVMVSAVIDHDDNARVKSRSTNLNGKKDNSMLGVQSIP